MQRVAIVAERDAEGVGKAHRRVGIRNFVVESHDSLPGQAEIDQAIAQPLAQQQ